MLLEDCDKKRPDWPPALTLLGECHTRIGARKHRANGYRHNDESTRHYDDARFYFERALQLAGSRQQSGETVLHLAECLATLGKNDEAAQRFADALRIAEQYRGRKTFVHLAHGKFWLHVKPRTATTLANARQAARDARASLVPTDSEYEDMLRRVDKFEQQARDTSPPTTSSRGRGGRAPAKWR